MDEKYKSDIDNFVGRCDRLYQNEYYTVDQLVIKTTLLWSMNPTISFLVKENEIPYVANQIKKNPEKTFNALVTKLESLSPGDLKLLEAQHDEQAKHHEEPKTTQTDTKSTTEKTRARAPTSSKCASSNRIRNDPTFARLDSLMSPSRHIFPIKRKDKTPVKTIWDPSQSFSKTPSTLNETGAYLHDTSTDVDPQFEEEEKNRISVDLPRFSDLPPPSVPSIITVPVELSRMNSREKRAYKRQPLQRTSSEESKKS